MPERAGKSIKIYPLNSVGCGGVVFGGI